MSTTLGWRFVNPLMKQMYGTDSMPETAENVAAEHGVSREDQDAFGLRSQAKAAAAANSAGRFADEIVAVGDVDTDEHPRPQTTPEALAGLKPAFRAGGTVTAGNASGINDGWSARHRQRARRAEELGDRSPWEPSSPLGRRGRRPARDGHRPDPRRAEAPGPRAGSQAGRLDLVELNEAFASQSLAVIRELGFDEEKVNVNGGAIALGHPLGMSGARLVVSLLHELRRRDGRYGLATLCVGVGQGVAALFVRDR